MAGVFLYARFIEPNLLVINKQSVKYQSVNEDYKIVFFTDTHIGEMYPQEKLERIVKKINSQNPDVVIFGGDFFDTYHKDMNMLDIDFIGETLAKIDAKYAKLAGWGNRDYGGGAVRVYEDLMATGGFTILKNEIIEIPQLNTVFYGLDDFLLGEPETNISFGGYKGFKAVISHSPDVFDSFSENEANYMLSGHSHGGQVDLPYITDLILEQDGKKYVRGNYNMENKFGGTMFVSRGIGVTKVPYRFLSVPEIVVIEVSN